MFVVYVVIVVFWHLWLLMRVFTDSVQPDIGLFPPGRLLVVCTGGTARFTNDDSIMMI